MIPLLGVSLIIFALTAAIYFVFVYITDDYKQQSLLTGWNYLYTQKAGAEPEGELRIYNANNPILTEEEVKRDNLYLTRIIEPSDKTRTLTVLTDYSPVLIKVNGREVYDNRFNKNEYVGNCYNAIELPPSNRAQDIEIFMKLPFSVRFEARLDDGGRPAFDINAGFIAGLILFAAALLSLTVFGIRSIVQKRFFYSVFVFVVVLYIGTTVMLFNLPEMTYRLNSRIWMNIITSVSGMTFVFGMLCVDSWFSKLKKHTVAIAFAAVISLLAVNLAYTPWMVKAAAAVMSLINCALLVYMAVTAVEYFNSRTRYSTAIFVSLAYMFEMAFISGVQLLIRSTEMYIFSVSVPVLVSAGLMEYIYIFKYRYEQKNAELTSQSKNYGNFVDNVSVFIGNILACSDEDRFFKKTIEELKALLLKYNDENCDIKYCVGTKKNNSFLEILNSGIQDCRFDLIEKRSLSEDKGCIFSETYFEYILKKDEEVCAVIHIENIAGGLDVFFIGMIEAAYCSLQIAYENLFNISAKCNVNVIFTQLSENAELNSGYGLAHIDNVSNYTYKLCRELGFDEEKAKNISTAAKLHDIGKIAIPKNILNKEGLLSEEEKVIIACHTKFGQTILSAYKNDPILDIAAEIAGYHHEKFDGTGYNGLKGEKIPLNARIVTVCDIFDALYSERSYKKAWSAEAALNYISENAGKIFDPSISATFIKMMREHNCFSEEAGVLTAADKHGDEHTGTRLSKERAAEIKPKKRFKWYHWAAAAILAGVTAIFAGWHFVPKKALNIVVLDKTVLSYSEDEDIVKDTVYRKHQGLYWILNQQKYVKNDGTDYDYEHDYYGPMLDDEGRFDHDVNMKDIKHKPDLVYLSDAYGLGNDTFGHYNGGSPKNPGITADDMSVITSSYENGAVIAAEMNLFSSSMEDSVYSQLSAMLGVTPKKWIGRYLVDLQDFSDVPDWAPPMYEQQEGVEWRFTGPGILLVSREGKIIILEQNTDFNSKDLMRIYLNDEYKEEFSGCSSSNFYNWFELIEPNYGTEQIATFEFDLNATGMEKIKEISKTPRFCAVSRRREEGHSPVYFFAGDFNDYVNGDRYGCFLFANQFFKFFSYDRQGDISNFYWNFYNPLIRKILDDTDYIELEEKKNDHLEIARVMNGRFQVYENDKWKDLPLKAVSVNPNEPCKEEYSRDFTFYETLIGQAAELGANCIEAKDLLPPEFYTALHRHNNSGKNSKIYLLQRINTPEGLKAEDYPTDKGMEKWKKNIENTIAVLHGKAGATGLLLGDATYFTDISDAVLGISIDPQLDPENCKKLSKASVESFARYLYETAQSCSKDKYGYYTPIAVRSQMGSIKDMKFTLSEENTYLFDSIAGKKDKDYFFNDVLFDERIYNISEYEGMDEYDITLSAFEELNKKLPPVLMSGISVSNVNSVYNQEAVSETQQGEELMNVLAASNEAGILGVTLYDLNDSWAGVSKSMYKFTSPQNESYMWHNTCDETQNTGLLAVQSKLPSESGLVLTDDDMVQQISMYSNPDYVYITLQLYEELDYKENALFVGLDTFQRNDGEYFYAKKFTPNSLSGMEYVLRFENKQQAALYVIDTYDRTKGSAYTVEKYDAEFSKVADLTYGGFNKGDNQFYQTGSTIYVRLPWTWLNVAAPHKKLVINDNDFYDESAKTVATNGIMASVMIGQCSSGDLMYGFPENKHDPGYKVFKWQTWENADYELRQKDSFTMLKKFFTGNQRLID